MRGGRVRARGFDLPRTVGLAFDLSAIDSGIYGAILMVVMLLRPHGLVPGRRIVERTATLTWGRSQQTLKFR